MRTAAHADPTEDPRWQVTTRYGRRLNANVRGVPNQWVDGDIIRMGFVSPVMSEEHVHRYTLRTDSEGFRNAVTRPAIKIAALGDSFTDALTMAEEDAWPAQLERRLGVAVQNYGTAGFGPSLMARLPREPIERDSGDGRGKVVGPCRRQRHS